MLIFIHGTDIRKKRAEIDSRVASRAEEGKAVRLFVPEQENFSRDKALMERFGERTANLCRTTSFTHFCREYLEAHGGAVASAADGAGETLLMSLALRTVAGELDVFRKHYRRPSSVAGLLGFYKEMKNAGLTPADLASVSKKLTGALAKKTAELSLICTAYEASLSSLFSDEADNIKAVAKLLPGEESFRNTEFVFDDFRGFTSPQIDLILALLPVCENVVVSIPSDAKSDPYGLHFEHALKNRERLLRGAAAMGIGTREEKVPVAQTGGGLATLRASLFSDIPKTKAPAPDDVVFFDAENRFGECEYIAMKIRELLLSGACRARDVAVLYRDDAYAPILLSAMKKYGVPAYTDGRRSLISFPLVRGLLSAVQLAAVGLDTETLLSYLKTGISPVTLEETAVLENYLYVWQLDGARLKTPFTGDVGGYGVKEDDAARREAEEKLGAVNAIREKALAPILKLSDALRNGSGKSDAAAVYYFLKEIGADENFLRLAEELNAAGNTAEALAYAGVWDRAMLALDTLAGAVGEEALTGEAFYELLTLLFTADTLGQVPAGVDKVQCGNVERIRVPDPYAVFMPGFSEGVYPKRSAPGILTDKEKRALGNENFSLNRLPEDRYEEERLLTFTALTSPEKYLFVGRSLMRVTGETIEPSPFLAEIRALFESVKVVSPAAIPPEEKASTLFSAVSALSAVYAENSPRASALAGAVAENGGEKQLSSLERAKTGVKPDLGEGTAGLDLFGKDLYLSASKTESYHKCPFAFFCRYGLGAEPLEVSRIDARINGLLVHEALETIFRRHRGEDVALLDDETMRRETDEAVENYIRESLSGRENLSPAVLRSLDRVKSDIFFILSVIRREFSSCAFKMTDMELKIGDEKKGLPAYVLTLPDGGRVIVTGSIDRVDAMSLDGQTFVRVVDYKTGGKDFNLSDVFEGLNMQMLIYLFAILRYGEKKFPSPRPAGILYVPAKSGGDTVDRRASEEEVLRMRLANGRMNGLILEDAEVIKGMETAARGVYIDASITDEGELKGKLLSREGFAALQRRVDAVLVETGQALHAGKIPAVPITDGTHDPCAWCKYASVCLKEADDEKRKALRLSHADAVEKLFKEDEDDA